MVGITRDPRILILDGLTPFGVSFRVFECRVSCVSSFRALRSGQVGSSEWCTLLWWIARCLICIQLVECCRPMAATQSYMYIYMYDVCIQYIGKRSNGVHPRLFRPNGGGGKTRPREAPPRAPTCFNSILNPDALARCPQPLPSTHTFSSFVGHTIIYWG